MGYQLGFLFGFLTAWTSVSLSTGEGVCFRPYNAALIDEADRKLNGTWSAQMNVNFGNLPFAIACDRMTFTFTSATEGLATNTFVDQSAGSPDTLTVVLYEMKIYGDEILRLRPFNDLSVNFFYYFYLINGNDLVVSICYYKNNELKQQYETVLTRSQTTPKDHAVELLRQVGVKYDKSYFYSNGDACYDLHRCQCPAGKRK